jgi:hypothetical protein
VIGLIVSKSMSRDLVMFWIAVSGVACWAVCFWWMRSISVKQNSVLAEPRSQAERIEQLSIKEHRLIKDVHPQVEQIKDGVDRVVDKVDRTSQ